MTREMVAARWVGELVQRHGWKVSQHVSAYRSDLLGPLWCCVMRGGDGRSIHYTRTLKEAAALGAAVDATKPTYDHRGMVTKAARRRIFDVVKPLRPGLKMVP